MGTCGVKAFFFSQTVFSHWNIIIKSRKHFLKQTIRWCSQLLSNQSTKILTVTLAQKHIDTPNHTHIHPWENKIIYLMITMTSLLANRRQLPWQQRHWFGHLSAATWPYKLHCQHPLSPGPAGSTGHSPLSPLHQALHGAGSRRDQHQGLIQKKRFLAELFPCFVSGIKHEFLTTQVSLCHPCNYM